ncbi:hypothetical protein F0357_20740 [Rhizobiales bacterium Sp-1]|uniref:Uncharacterized protein n=1 Tax=Segnochrobactrum spirostomi TaxID=2608987 RepID=A0A6A7Y847_9HYPH|nr:hypothetical protein [Segnochrobactrum spirostomi]
MSPFATETSATIADAVVQELTAAILGSEACRNWLDRPEPDIAEAQAAIEHSIVAARRAAELVKRLRSSSVAPSVAEQSAR